MATNAHCTVLTLSLLLVLTRTCAHFSAQRQSQEPVSKLTMSHALSFNGQYDGSSQWSRHSRYPCGSLTWAKRQEIVNRISRKESSPRRKQNSRIATTVSMIYSLGSYCFYMYYYDCWDNSATMLRKALKCLSG